MISTPGSWPICREKIGCSESGGDVVAPPVHSEIDNDCGEISLKCPSETRTANAAKVREFKKLVHQ